MKIATWNINSLNVRLPHVQDWLQQYQPDVLVLQELKLDQDKFPAAAIEMLGFHAAWSGQKTYNGVRIINVYCVNGEAVDSPKFAYKQQWFAALHEYVRAEMAKHPKLVLLGDFNIAPTDIDVYDPQKWHEKVLCSSAERSWLPNLLDLALIDSLRHIHPAAVMYTWWDYRMNMFQRKLGMRIDHILISEAMLADLESTLVDTEARSRERPSDHAPVMAVFRSAD